MDLVWDCGRVTERTFCVASVVRRSDGKRRDVVHSVGDGGVMCKDTGRVVGVDLFVDGCWGVGVGWSKDRDVVVGRILVMDRSMVWIWRSVGGMVKCVAEI